MSPCKQGGRDKSTAGTKVSETEESKNGNWDREEKQLRMLISLEASNPEETFGKSLYFRLVKYSEHY